MYMMVLMLGQSVMVTGVTVIVLHATHYNVLQVKTLVTISMETKQCTKILTRPIIEPDLCAKFPICTFYIF